MITNEKLDDFCRRMHISNDGKIEGHPITGVAILLELFEKFANECLNEYKNFKVGDIVLLDNYTKVEICDIFDEYVVNIMYIHNEVCDIVDNRRISPIKKI